MGRPAAQAGRWLAVAALAASTALTACGSAASAAAPSVPLFVQDSVVRGSTNLTAKQRPAEACVLNSRFAHNQQIIWRIRVFDPRTGQPMDGRTLRSVTVALAGGTRLQARYGNHSTTAHDPATSFWTAAWVVPSGYPTGTLSYKVTAVASDGRQGSLVPFDVPSSLLQVTSAVQPVARQQARS